MQRYKNIKVGDYEYKVDRFLVFSGAIIILTLLLYVLYLDDWSGEYKYYTSCDIKDGVCINPFVNSTQCEDVKIKDTPLCTQYIMFPGQAFGTPPSFWYNNFEKIGWSIVLLIIILNTILYNKEFVKNIYKKLRE